MSDEEITSERRAALLGAALHAVAWELVEYETDTSDRGVSEAHYRNAVDQAKALLPVLFPPAAGVVAEEPEWGCRSRAHIMAARDHGAVVLVDAHDAAEHDCPSPAIVYRRKAGPWVPAKQEGSETDV